MHREHDPHEWSDWTARLFPVTDAAHSAAETKLEAKPGTGHAHAHSHDNHHHEHDPVEAAELRAQRRSLQNGLALVIGALLVAELVIWLTGSWPATWSYWLSPARWAAVLGTVWICHGVLENLVEGRIGADLALAQAALAALFLGEDAVAAEVVFISLVGEWLEDVAYRRAQKAIGSLIDQAPRTAWVLRAGEWTEVPAGSVIVGETVAVEAGATIPVDGIVSSGRSSLDASSLTGESIPVDVAPGDRVACGQINQFGRLEIEAERVGMDSTLGQVVKLMTKAQGKKAKLQRMADRYARYFLPAVETAALATLLLGFAMNWPDRWLRAVAVLVVACPCPLVLATPATILAAWATLARRGVIVKSGAALEQFALCDTLALDKTGTLTQGRPDLTRFETVRHAMAGNGLSESSIASLTVAVERTNPHPLAQALVDGLAERATMATTLVSSVTRPGAGVLGEARLEGSGQVHQVLIGNLRLMTEEGVTIDEGVESVLAESDSHGETPLLVAIDGRVVATLALADPVRPEAHDMVHDLKHLGFGEVAILTGDRPGAAGRIGRKVHVGNVLSEMSPTAKAGWIQDRLVAGRIVAMVGDGINDAPALAVARVGLAVSKVGANLAAEAGDIILMHDPLRSLVRTREVSQAAVKILRQNILWFAFGLNGLAVLLAGLGVLSPLGAAIFHQIGSLAVLCNALRILAFDQLKPEAIQHRAEHMLESFDRQVGRTVRGAYAALPSLRLVITLGLMAGAFALIGNNVRSVGPNEMLVRFRAGAFAGVSGPGLYVGLPWPLESVHRVAPKQWLQARIGQASSLVLPSPATPGWSDADPEATPADLWLTGDGQLAELSVSLQALPDSSPDNLAAMIRNHADPLAHVSAEVARSMRQAVAGIALERLLTQELHELVATVRADVLNRLRTQPGLRLADLVIAVDRVGPPWPVTDAFREAARASHQAERIAIDASTQAASAGIEAESEARKLVEDATAGAADRLTTAKAQADAFRTFVSARKSHTNLTDHRLFWSQLSEILKDRPKMLLDVPRGDLYGVDAPKRHLVLPEAPILFAEPVASPSADPEKPAPEAPGARP